MSIPICVVRDQGSVLPSGAAYLRNITIIVSVSGKCLGLFIIGTL